MTAVLKDSIQAELQRIPTLKKAVLRSSSLSLLRWKTIPLLASFVSLNLGHNKMTLLERKDVIQMGYINKFFLNTL